LSTRDGYTLDGWFTDAAGGTEIDANTPVIADVTYYAHWAAIPVPTPATVTVKFNAAGGSNVADRTINQGVRIGTLPVTTRTGYTFAGWYTIASGGTQITATTVVNTDVTYYAHWTAKQYTVTYNVNGGNALAAKTKTVTYGSAYGALTTPTRTGHTFAGWYTAAPGGTKITATTTVKTTAAQTLYAHWTAKQYTVTYNVNCGHALVAKTKTVTYGSAYGALTTPIRIGHSFAGWYTAAKGGTKITSTTTVTITAAQTLYAHWTAKQHIVSATLNSAQTQIALTASNTQNLSGIKGVRFAVWGNAGGQNDLKWYTGTNLGGGKYSVSAPVSNHKETGLYLIHVYATLTNGASVIIGATSVTVSAPSGTATSQNINTGKGTFQVKLSGIKAPSGVTEVQIPVWSASNQSDIYWYKATKQSDGSYIANVNIKNHKYNYGTYIAHCYVRGGNGTFAFAAAKSIPLPAPKVSVTASHSVRTQISAIASNVVRLPGVSNVRFAVWGNAGGQHDLKWYTANKTGASTYQFIIPVSNHRETGTYSIHAYATLTNGTSVYIGASTVKV
jgi:uncharacterized repeat protein (TIGR02543 family)